ncbi:hypothetical protein [Tahibacter caeni]|uniref:hypothetical protein n=1 Tax=Tahibacter caeni TaxID=1453545 RepID=UPI002148B3A1|nr:hypothetical protein [Tahibacter caeni]
MSDSPPPMPFPFGTPLRIVECRDFYDVPHVILAAGGLGYWMLDAPFDDVLDDFSPEYSLSFAGVDSDGARAYFAAVCEGRTAADVIGRIARTRLEFDATRRRELICR